MYRMSSTWTAGGRPVVQNRTLNAATVLFLFGLIPGFYESRHPEAFGFGRGYEMAAIARSLAATNTFGNPFEPHITGPTASNPPLYPFLLGVLLKAFGPSGTVLIAILLNILLNAAIAALLPRLSSVFFGDRVPGIFAGGFWILTMRLMPQWDTTCTVAGMIVICLLVAHDVAQSRYGLGTGIVCGAVSLLNPSVVLIFVPWVVYVLVVRRVPRLAAFRYIAFVLAAVAVCNLPWIVRNYRLWHAPVLRTNLGYTIYSSNNDCAQPSLYWNTRVGCYQRTHPSASAAEIRLLETLGEVEYDRLRLADSLRWIGSHPRRFRELTFARFVEFWFPNPGIAPRTAYAIWIITALSFPGILLMARRRESVAIYTVAVWILYPLLFYVVVSDERYRFPLLWTSLLAAGYFAAHVWSRYVCPGAHLLSR
ncbi:MAG: hypothetical protein JWP63_2104 [Candidatus Solibacter sp.]|nr:hypothetical protein [Candidatus Solibacter sp.]